MSEENRVTIEYCAKRRVRDVIAPNKDLGHAETVEQ